MADSFSIDFSLLDESFNPQETHQYGLGMVLNEKSAGICILDIRRDKFIGLVQFNYNNGFPEEHPETDIQTSRLFLSEVCNAIPWLLSPFKMVRIAYSGRKSTLIPAPLFDPGAVEDYLKFNFVVQNEEVIFSDHLISLDAWQVFSVPESLVAVASELFPKTRMIHLSGLLIESVWINYKNRITTPHVFLNVRETLFDLMIFDGRKMSYFNTFSFQNPEEVAYYLIFVLEQLDLNPEQVSLVIMGNVESKAGLPDLLLRYIRHIEMARRNESYRYSYVLNQVPAHACFPLLNLFSCGL